MNDTDRVIGELQEFKRATLGELAVIKRSVEKLNEFRWRVAGAAAVISMAVTIVIQALHALR